METWHAYEIEGHGIYWELFHGTEYVATYETEAELDAATVDAGDVVKHTYADWEAQELAAEAQA